MTADDISETNVWQLVQAVSESEKYAFLIGAGTSKPEPAGIPTGGELIETWRQECYEKVNSDTDLKDWAEEREKQEMDYDQNPYGFWFEKRHPTRGERRNRIDKLVREADPTPGHITLASLMGEGYVPHVITPNFDDLLFDAFYLFLEDKPNLIDHRAVAPEFKLTRDDPTIVKLHGDYLYDNLQNTDTETEALEPAMEDALQQTATEYGLVVVGYSGTDDSIMDPLLNADLSEYGIYWCVRDTDEISAKVGELLEQPNTHLVEIDGFLSLMEAFYDSVDEVELPERSEFIERAMSRADLLEGMLEESTESTKEAAFEQALNRMAAQRAADKGRHTHAIELLDEVIENQPDVAAYVNRGNSKMDLNRYEEAIEDYNNAIELDPEASDAYYNRGNVKVHLGRYEEAIEDYDKAIEIDPEEDKAYGNRGNVKSDLERHEEALRDYDKAIEIDPEDSKAYVNRGNTKSDLENHEGAIEDYTKAIELDPNNANSYYNRAIVYENIERYEKALEDFDQVIEIEPENDQAYINRGIVNDHLGRYEEAIGDFSQAIEFNPENSKAYINRARVKDESGQYESALQDLNQGIKLEPENSRLYVNRGTVKHHLGRNEEALEDLDQAIEIDPKNDGAYTNRGYVKSDLGRHEEALEDLNQAIKMNPESRSAYAQRGHVKTNLNRFNEAIEDYDKISEVSEETVTDLQNKSEIHLVLCEFSEAEETAIEAESRSTSTGEKAISLLLKLIAKLVQGDDTSTEEAKIEDICEKKFTITWSFQELDHWLEKEEGELENTEKINEYIDLLREHREEN